MNLDELNNNESMEAVFGAMGHQMPWVAMGEGLPALLALLLIPQQL